MDKLGPIEIEFVLDKKADEQAQKLKGSLDAIGTSSKNSIQQQKELIKSIEEGIKQLEKEYEKAAPGKQQQNMLVDLRSARQSLITQTKELTSLQEEEEKSTNSLANTIGGWLGKVVAGAVVLRELKKAFLETTQGINIFNNAAAAYKQILYDIVNGAGPDLGRVMQAIAYQQKLNELRTKGYETEIEVAKHKAAFEEYYVQIYDATLDRQKKIQIIDEAVAENKKSASLEIEHQNELLKIQIDQLTMNPTKESLKQQVAQTMVTLYGLQNQAEFQSKRLLSMKATLEEEGIKEERAHQGRMKLIHEGLIQAAKDDLKDIAAQEKIFDDALKAGDMVWATTIANRIVELQKLQNKLEENKKNMLLVALLGGRAAISQMFGESFTGEEGQQILPGEGKSPTHLAFDLPTEAEVNLRLISDKVKKELGLDSNGNFTIPVGMDIKGTKGAQENIQKIIKDQEDSNKKQKKSDVEKVRDQQEILRGAMQFTEELGKQLGLSQDVQAELQNMEQIAMDLAEGNYIAAAFSFATQILSIFKLTEQLPETPAWQLELKHWDELITREERLIQLASRTGGEEQILRDKIAGLQAEEAILLKLLADERERLHLPAGVLMGPMIDWNKQLQDIRDQLQDSETALQDFLAGGTTQNTIADAIAEGFRAGKKSIDDFAEYMNNVLLDAITGVFKTEILGSAINNLTASIAQDLSDGNLTPQEMKDLKAQWDAIIKDSKDKWDMLAGGLGLGTDAGGSASLTGAIKGVSEETASVLAGQVNAIRISQAETGGIIRQQLIHLAEIASNTRYNRHLESIDSKLDALSSGSLRATGLI